ncbi:MULTISPECIES: M50 family metallopeptidase [Sphingomonas]|uniref:RIP metalloprotease RseP n=1 Tax=Sphingomonas hankookensis TaxID=563996 RepID=A0ABR5YD28_9SPHN|nr:MULTISPECIES: M50 family metallopeptidase [Sphingomonas]KZE15380.1 RIP metalloprotease RseP [Sphingomonas hankookensis]WCP70973.1 M50 family metallopeptidase [Sphingomonas hankookensis]
MIESPGLLMTIIAFLLVLGPLVFLHELGHYAAGRWFGVKVDAFSVGFGREIAGFTDRHGTRWKFGWLPLGGYVRFAGDMNPASQPDAEWLQLPAHERARTFQAKPVWQRAIIVAAGPAVNLLLAVLILGGFAAAYGVDRTPATVGGVVQGSAADRAGLQPGDRIAALDGRTIETFSDLSFYTAMHPGERVTVEYLRGGAAQKTDAVIGSVVQRDRFGNEAKIGRFGIERGPPVYAPLPLWQAPAEGTRMVGAILRGTVDGLWQIITGRRSMDEMGGPLRIAKTSGEQLSLGWPALVTFVAFVSINLGFINLLPVPMLDGGHLFFYAIEAVKRGPVSPQTMEWAFRGGLALLLALMIFVTVNDLGAFGVWRGLAGLIG